MSKPLSGYTKLMELLQSESGWNRIRVCSISSNSQEEMQPEWYNLGATKFDRWFMERDQVLGGGVIDCLDVRLQPMNISGSLPKDFVSPLLSLCCTSLVHSWSWDEMWTWKHQFFKIIVNMYVSYERLNKLTSLSSTQ